MDFIKIEPFGTTYAADTLRRKFNLLNEQAYAAGIRPDCIFIGDSITEYLEPYAWFGKDHLILNRGIGGDITEAIARRAAGDVFQFHPKRVVYLAGINDICSTEPDRWWREEGKNGDAVLAALPKNIEKFLDQATDEEIYICSILPTDPCPFYDKERVNAIVVDMNRKIRQLCQTRGVTYVDYHSRMVGEDGKTMRDGLTWDGVHPNAAGYRIMTDLLKEIIPDLR